MEENQNQSQITTCERFPSFSSLILTTRKDSSIPVYYVLVTSTDFKERKHIKFFIKTTLGKNRMEPTLSNVLTNFSFNTRLWLGFWI